MRQYVLGISIFLGAVLSSYILGKSIKEFRTENRIISVKGLAEREVKADLAVWELKFSASNNDKDATFSELDNYLTTTLTFLKEYGITDAEITRGYTDLADKLSQRYVDSNNAALRYRATTSLFVKSHNVEAVSRAVGNLESLLKKGVYFDNEVFSMNNYNGPRYVFTKLNDIKLDMLAEATSNAQNAAVEFVANTNAGQIGGVKNASSNVVAGKHTGKIGRIKNANQGVFQFYSNENRAEEQSIDKVVRVIVNVDYYLE